MEPTSLVTKFEVDLEVRTRVQRDSWLAAFTGQPWEPATTPYNSLPDYSALVDIEEGQTLRDAIDTLDSSKNRRIVFQNSIGGVVVDNPNFLKFSGFSLTPLDGGNGLLIAISSDVVYKAGTATESLAFGFRGVGFGTKFFTGGRFAYGMSVNYSTFSSIKSSYSAISSIVLHGCQGRVAPAGTEGGGEMRPGTVVRDNGSIYSAASSHPTTSLNRPSNTPRPVEWRGEGRLNAGDCLKYWIAGGNFTRGTLVLAGNMFYVVLRDVLGAQAYPPSAPEVYHPLWFHDYATKTTFNRGDKVTDIDARGSMRTLRMAKEQYNTGNESLAVLSRGSDIIWHDVTENMTWTSVPKSHIFVRGDIVRHDSSSTTLYVCITKAVQKDTTGGNPISGDKFSATFRVQTKAFSPLVILGTNSLSIGDAVSVTPASSLQLPTNLAPGNYWVVSEDGNELLLSGTPGGQPIIAQGVTSTSGGTITAVDSYWVPLTGIVPWFKGRTTDPGAFYCHGMGKIVCSRRRGYVDNSAPSLDSSGSSWWFVNDNYRLNPANQRTNASNVLEWPAVGSSIVVTG